MAGWSVVHRGQVSRAGELPGGSETEILTRPPSPGSRLPGSVLIQGQAGMDLIYSSYRNRAGSAARHMLSATPLDSLGPDLTFSHHSFPFSRSCKRRRPQQLCFCLPPLISPQTLNWALLVGALSLQAAVSYSSSPIFYLLHATFWHAF